MVPPGLVPTIPIQSGHIAVHLEGSPGSKHLMHPSPPHSPTAVARLDLSRDTRHLRAYLRSLGCAPDLAEDLVQEVMLLVLQGRLPPLSPARRAVYLRTCARNLFLKQRPGRPLPLDPQELEQLSALWAQHLDPVGSPLLDALERCVAQLGPRARRALAGRFAEDLPRGDLARELDLDPASLTKLLQRSKAQLRRCIHATLPSDPKDSAMPAETTPVSEAFFDAMLFIHHDPARPLHTGVSVSGGAVGVQGTSDESGCQREGMVESTFRRWVFAAAVLATLLIWIWPRPAAEPGPVQQQPGTSYRVVRTPAELRQLPGEAVAVEIRVAALPTPGVAPEGWSVPQDLEPLQRLAGLRALRLTNFGKLDAAWLRSLPRKLQSLQLSGCHTDPDWVRGLPQLDRLRALDCGYVSPLLSIAQLEVLTTLPKLQTLKLGGLRVEKLRPADFDLFRRCKELSILHLYAAPRIPAAVLAPLRAVRGLRELCLPVRAIDDAGLAQLARFPRLERLRLTGGSEATIEGPAAHRLGAKGLAALAAAPQLRALFLDGVAWTAAELRALGACRTLRYLDLEDCGLDREQLTALAELGQLETLLINLRGNVADAAVLPLTGLRKLRHLSISRGRRFEAVGKEANPNLGAETLDRLRAALPNCDIQLPVYTQLTVRDEIRFSPPKRKR